MKFLSKLLDKITEGIKFLTKHKVYLLIFIPIIAALVFAIVLISKGENREKPNSTTTEATSGTSETPYHPTVESTSESAETLESLPSTLDSSETLESEATTEITEELRDPNIPLVVERTDIIGIHEMTDDGIVLMTGELDVPVFANTKDNPAIAMINEEIVNYAYELRARIVKDCRPIAENDLTSDSPSIPFNSKSTAEVTLSSDTTVSVLYSTWIYTGDENVSLHRDSVTYFIADGTVCDLSDLFGDNISALEDTVREKIKTEISAAPDEFYPDYEGLVDFYSLENRWYLSEESGFCVYYVPYELAGYAKGVLTYSVSIGDLNEYLMFNPAYTSFAE